MSRRTRGPPQTESVPRPSDLGQQAQPQVMGQSTSPLEAQQPAYGQAPQQQQSYPKRHAQTAYEQGVPSIHSSYRQLYIDPEDLKPELAVESSSRGRLSQSRATPAEVFVQTQASVHKQFRKVKVEQAHQFGVNTEDAENQSPKRRRDTAKTYKDQGVLLQVPALRAVTLDWQASTLQLQNHEDAELFDLLVISDRVQGSIDVFFFFFEASLFTFALVMLFIFFYAPDHGSADDYMIKTIALEPFMSRGALCLSELSLVATAVRLKKVKAHLDSFDHSFCTNSGPRGANQTHRTAVQTQLGLVFVAFIAFACCVVCCLVTTKNDWELANCHTCSSLAETPLATGNKFVVYKGLVVTKGISAVTGALASLYDIQCESAFRLSRLPDAHFGKVEELS